MVKRVNRLKGKAERMKGKKNKKKQFWVLF
jgi:hypothetical protein